MLLGSVVLGATVLQDPIAWAATPFQNVIVANTADQPVPVNQQGTANVNVTNTANVQPVIPAGAFSFEHQRLLPVDAVVVSGPDPAGTRYAITSFTVASGQDDGVNPGEVHLASQSGPTTVACDPSGPAPVERFGGPVASAQAGGTAHLDFPQPFVLPAGNGDKVCLLLLGVASKDITVVGYRF